MTDTFHKRFLNGLKRKYNLTMKDIIEQDYKYAGGTEDDNNPRHYNYWETIIAQKPHLKMPTRECFCVCDHIIKNNCFIINKYDNIIVLGNCCIKRFIPKSGRTCGRCGEPHKNRKINLCNDCKVYACNACGKDKEEIYYKLCNKCFYNNDDSDNEENDIEQQYKIDCKGKGECFRLISIENYTYEKNECNFHCELKTCKECNTQQPEWVLDCRKGLCYKCDIERSEKGSKIYLQVSYKDKEEAKLYGCRWNPDKKKWFFFEKNENKDFILSKWKLENV